MSVKAIRTTLCEGVAILVLAGCEPAAPTPVAAKPSIEGEWTVTEWTIWEYNDDLVLARFDLAEKSDMVLIFTDEGTVVMTFDPPLPSASETGPASVIRGSYELLSDSRMLLGTAFRTYTVTASTLEMIGPSNKDPDLNDVLKAERL